MNSDDLDFGATLRGLTAGQHVFNRYQLTRILGQGGMGIVWLAKDEQLDRDVALKFLPEMIANDRDAIEDMKRETRKALVLTHPRIVRIYDFIQDSRRAAVSMEFVDGATLSAMKYDEPGAHFTAAKLTPWIAQLCEALVYAHGEAKIAHRDLKPANLMIDKNGMLKVADFGISATLTDSTTRASHTASTSGTPVYMSPQQMLGQKASPTDDVYSLGATIYELLTGKPPFYSGNIVLQAQNVVPPSMTERRAELGVTSAEPIPQAWEETVAACLAKDAKDRPQSAAEVWERLNGKNATHASAATTRPAEAAKPARMTEREPQAKAVGEPWPMLKKPGFVTAILCIAVALVACGWWYGIRVPELERQAEQARQLEVARQEAADKAAEAQRLREEQARKDAAAKAERERLAAEQEKREADARAEAARKAEEEAKAKGTLVVESNPSGATVIDSNGKNCGTTPLRFEEIKPGNYTVTLKANGYEDATVNGEVTKHETLRLYAAMKAVETPALVAQAVASSSRPATTSSASGNAPRTEQNYTVPTYNIEMVWIAPGSFNMGYESSPHRVTLTRGYWLGKYEVTQGQWEAVMGNNPSYFPQAGRNAPVEQVSWEDAQEYCKKLTDKERAAGRLPAGYEYSLPSEAQWEYACRAGTNTAFGYGSDEGNLWQHGNYCDRSNTNDFGWKDKNHNDGYDKTAPVGSYKPNGWGLYDMHGNVWEWCADWYGDYPSGAVTDPTGATSGSGRVHRGGGWDDKASSCRSASRNGSTPGYRDSFGFRLALSSVR
jgi:formylglycine-generating enzyme required for sulfatase activity